MAKDTQRLWAKCVFSFRQDLPLWLQGNWSWLPHESCCLSFPHICLPLAAALLGSSLAFAWCGCFLPACASPSWYFWVATELPWSYLSGLMQEGFLFGLCCSLSFSLSSPWLSCVEECWLLGFPVISLVLFTIEGKKMQSLGLTQNWRCFFLHDNSKPSLIFSVLICISNCYCKCCFYSVQL